MKQSSNMTTLFDYFSKEEESWSRKYQYVMWRKSTQFMLIAETPCGHGQQKQK
jgi:hypothetical protein